MNRQVDIEPQHEDDWLCTVEFLPTDDLEGHVFAGDVVGYLLGYAQLANARTLALVGDREAGAYEILFSFSTPGDKDRFLDLVRSNEDMGSDYIENDFMSPTTEEIQNALPLVAVLPEDIVSRATLIASVLCAGTERSGNASVEVLGTLDPRASMGVVSEKKLAIWKWKRSAYDCIGACCRPYRKVFLA